MKKFNRNLLITAGVMVLAGAVLFGAGFAFGGRSGFYINKTGIHSANSGREIYTYTQEKTKIDSFHKMKVSVSYGDILVEPSDGYYLEYQLSGNKREPVWEVQNDTLTFKDADIYSWNESLYFFAMGGIGVQTTTPKSYLKLYLPADVYYDMVDLHLSDGDISWEKGLSADTVTIQDSYGDITLKGIQAKNLQVTSSDGIISLTDCSGDEVSVNDSYGDVNITGLQAKNLQLELADGDLNLKQIRAEQADMKNSYGQVTGYGVIGNSWKIFLSSGDLELEEMDLKETNVTNHYGSVTLEPVGPEEDYNIDINNSYGSIIVNAEEYESSAKFNNRASKSIQVNCSDGDIIIKNQEP